MSITWLHVSDFHIRSGDPYDRDVVLQALVKSVAEYRKRGRIPDVIFATGDIAHGGKAEEYKIASTFFNDLLEAAQLGKDKLFVIPGNHDVDRDMGIGLARTLDSREQADTYFHSDRPKPHLTLKLGAFLHWHNDYFQGIRTTPSHSTCGPVQSLEVKGQQLGILPVNSALFCQGDDDHDKLWVGRRCLSAALTELSAQKAEINIILIHHPLEWLSATEGANIQGELEASAHILLRGHLHETRIESVASAEGEILRCAAGAAYQSRKWPNRALYATLDGNYLTIYPIRYEDSPRPVWTTDSSVFPHENGHQKSFLIPRLQVAKAEPQVPEPARPVVLSRFRSNIPTRVNRPFVGRDHLMTEIADALNDPTRENVVVLHGPPGVGKSELAREFARRHHDRYSSGTFLVDASTDAIAINLATIGNNILDLHFRSDVPLNDQGQQTFHVLGAAPVLLIYDNVRSFDRILEWLPLSGMPCHVLITTLLDSRDYGWPCMEVKPLTHTQSMELVEKLTGNQLPPRFTEAIADHAGGLPVQIIPDATTLAYEQRRGRLKPASLKMAQEAGKSFRAAYDRLEPPAQLLLHAAAFLNPQRIPIGELSQHLQMGLGWREGDLQRSLDTCLDLHLLEGTPDPTMHQLFASFLRETPLSPQNQAELAKVRPVQATRFVELANAICTNPADIQAASKFLAYPITPEAWNIWGGEALSVEEGATAGRALYEIGHFEQAQPWFERAVAEKEKGDVHGRVDHQSLGISLNQVGNCLSSTGQYKEAQPWFERSVAEAEKGDVHGRVDHQSLGISLNQVGNCLSSTGQYKEAQPWFERSVAEAEKGDVHGRVDHQSLGISLNQVGNCLSSTGQYKEAQPWYERAVAEAEKGDVHGRVDHQSLGISLNQVGNCLSSMEQYEQAQTWFECAVTKAEKGDVHGRVDYTNFAIILRNGADCLRKLGQTELARKWEQRASEIDSQSSVASSRN